MSRNDVVMTPLRVKQAIDSRFVKPSEDELIVLINGTWVEFTKVVDEPVLPPAVDCAELSTMYKGDTTLTETPVINATGCTSLKEVFKGCTNLKTVKYIHTPNVTSMDNTFRNCTSLTSIPEMDTSKVDRMYYTFYACSSLTSITELDTSNVTNMQSTFEGCSSLTSIPELDTSNVTIMRSTFNRCSSLTEVTFTGTQVPPFGTKMFNSTGITTTTGTIYVPDNLYDQWIRATNWVQYADIIKKESERP